MQYIIVKSHLQKPVFHISFSIWLNHHQYKLRVINNHKKIIFKQKVLAFAIKWLIPMEKKVFLSVDKKFAVMNTGSTCCNKYKYNLVNYAIFWEEAVY